MSLFTVSQALHPEDNFETCELPALQFMLVSGLCTLLFLATAIAAIS